MTVDMVPPTISVTSDKASLRAGQTATLMFTLSERVTDFVVSDIVVSGGTLSNFTGSGITYTATFTPSLNSISNGVVSVASNKFSDAGGNVNVDGSDANNTVTMTVDTVPPTIVVTSDKTSLRTGQAATLTFALSEAAIDFVAGDITVSGGTLINFSGSGTAYTATFVPNSNSKTNGVTSVASNKFSDAFGNVNVDGSEANNTVTMMVDTVPPTIVVTSDKTNLRAGEAATLTFTLSETSTDFGIRDITVSGGSLSNFSGSGANYTATFKLTDNWTANAVVSVESNVFSDAIGNVNDDGMEANNTVTMIVDVIPPKIAITSNKSSLRAGQTTALTFTLSETVKDFDVSDIVVSGGTLSNFAGSGTTYTATFTPSLNSNADGIVSVASNKFSDAVGNVNVDGSDANNAVTITVDTIPPTIVVTSDKTGLAVGQTAVLTFVLREAAVDFVASDIAVSGGTLSDFKGSGSNYTATFIPTANSTANAKISVGSNKFSDVAGNFNVDGADVNNTVTMTVDTVRPKVAITSNKSSLAINQRANVTFTISESVTDFTLDDVLVSNGRLIDFANVGLVYTATFVPNDNTTAVAAIRVLSNKFSDSVGNFNDDGAEANNTLNISVDTARPTILITSDKSSLFVGQTAKISFLLNERSTDFAATDVTVTGGKLSNFGGSGTIYTAIFTPTDDGTVAATVGVADGKFSDVLGNFNSDGAEENNKVNLSISRIKTTNLKFTIMENTTGITLMDTTDSLLGRTPTFTLTGDDASQFKISSAGVIAFASGKDFEQPTDKDKDNVYSVSVISSNPSSSYKTVTNMTVNVEFSEMFGTASTNAKTRGNDQITGTVGWDTINGMGGNDTLSGSWGLDVFKVGDGRSTITDFNMITNASTPTKLNEVLIVSAGAVVDVTLKAPWVATLQSVNSGTVNLNVSGNAVDLSKIPSGGIWNLTNSGAATQLLGTQGSDSLIGGSGRDTLLGGAGDDFLAGGVGLDTLWGGAGSDTFRFGGNTETDRITDFASGTDRIELDSKLYKTLTPGGLDSSVFLLGTTATSAGQRLIYDQAKGALYYDADGSGRVVPPILIGLFDNKPDLKAGDFTII